MTSKTLAKGLLHSFVCTKSMFFPGSGSTSMADELRCFLLSLEMFRLHRRINRVSVHSPMVAKRSAQHTGVHAVFVDASRGIVWQKWMHLNCSLPVLCMQVVFAAMQSSIGDTFSRGPIPQAQAPDSARVVENFRLLFHGGRGVRNQLKCYSSAFTHWTYSYSSIQTRNNRNTLMNSRFLTSQSFLSAFIHFWSFLLVSTLTLLSVTRETANSRSSVNKATPNPTPMAT